MVTPSIHVTPGTLREVRLLQKLGDAELAELIKLGQLVRHEPHSNIVIEGELSWGLYLILDGTVGIFKTNKLTGDAYDVGQLRSGRFFGEMSLIDDNARSATVRAMVDTQLFFLSKDAFMSLLSRSASLKMSFYENCIHDLITRLRDLDDNYVISQYQLWKSAIKKEVA